MMSAREVFKYICIHTVQKFMRTMTVIFIHTIENEFHLFLAVIERLRLRSFQQKYYEVKIKWR